MISRSTIDKVFETARVEEVIGEFVQLKKAGSNLKGLSPFSDERTPSFMVSPVKQIWKDFSSGKGGNVISFLMEHEHYSYPEAIRYLAKKYNIDIEETEQTDEQKQQADERESMFLVSEFARDYFVENIQNHEEGKAIGYSYFEERGFSAATIAKFELGYALNSWDAFTKEAEKKGFELTFLEKTGLTIVKQDDLLVPAKKFDRFKGRVMFPIHSMSGRVLGFGGRILTNDKKAAKYLNSPESEIYHKSKVLYGIYFAKQSIAKEDNCYLVEGYTDVISFHQAGIENVVSSSGTALTEDQIRLINRLTPNVTMLFDGDAAGIRASIRGIDLLLAQGLNVKVVLFPDGEDPDSFSKKVSPVELKKYITENAQDFIKFKVNLLLKDAHNDPVKKAGLIRDIVMSISKIPDRIKQEVYLKECAALMEISEVVLFSELAQISKKEIRDASKQPIYQKPLQPILKKTPEFKPVNELDKYEQEIIKILLLYGQKNIEFEGVLPEDQIEDTDKNKSRKYYFENLISKEIYLNLQEDEVEFTNLLFRQIYDELIHDLIQDEKLELDEYVNHKNKEIATIVTNILMDDEKYSLSNWERKKVYPKSIESDLPKMVLDAIYNLRRVLIDEKIKSLMENVKEANSNQDTLEMVINYTNLKQKIFEQLHRVV